LHHGNGIEAFLGGGIGRTVVAQITNGGNGIWPAGQGAGYQGGVSRLQGIGIGNGLQVNILFNLLHIARAGTGPFHRINHPAIGKPNDKP
jgi:hypothetical protein